MGIIQFVIVSGFIISVYTFSQKSIVQFSCKDRSLHRLFDQKLNSTIPLHQNKNIYLSDFKCKTVYFQKEFKHFAKSPFSQLVLEVKTKGSITND